MTNINDTTNSWINSNTEFPEFRGLRVLGTKEDPLFLAYDVQEALGLSKINYGRDYKEGVDYIKHKVYHADKMRDMNVFTECGLYSLAFRCNTQFGENFRTFVFVILKRLRLTGAVTIEQAKQDYAAEKTAMQARIEMLDQECEKEHAEMKRYKELYEANTENTMRTFEQIRASERRRKENARNDTDLANELRLVKEAFYTRVFLKRERAPKGCEAADDEYDTETPVEDMLCVWSISWSKPADDTYFAWVPPKLRIADVEEFLKDYTLNDNNKTPIKGRFYASAIDLIEALNGIHPQPKKAKE